MKRSEINAALKEMEQMVKEYRFALPPFCSFTPEQWQKKGHDYDEIRDNMLGWDITDYGMGNFSKMGFSLITIRNGNLKMKKYPKTYAEKLLYLKEGSTPLCTSTGPRWRISLTAGEVMRLFGYITLPLTRI